MLVPGMQCNDSVFLYIFHSDHHDKSSHHLNIQRYYIIIPCVVHFISVTHLFYNWKFV